LAREITNEGIFFAEFHNSFFSHQFLNEIVVENSVARKEKCLKGAISKLAKEITSSKNNAFVIADGVDKKVCDHVLTFQSAKGRNGLQDKDIYVVLQNLHPE